MATVELTEQEWQAVLGMIALAPWREANPLLMKIGDQLRRAQNSGHFAPGRAPEAEP